VDERVNYARPSIDVLFETAAEAYREQLIGIILTGANNDGSRGLKRIKELGGMAIVQDPDTAEVGSMPKAAIQSCAVDHILSLEEISALLNTL
jgi:two-component system chemotaxis response regulator CheB